MVAADGSERRARLSLRTLLIASVAATAAALITSRLWTNGAILSTAITPLIVAIVSELLHRPADRVAQLRADSRGALRPDAVVHPGGRTDQSVAVSEPLDWAPTRVFGRERVRLKLVLATGVAAFVIAAAALTLPELIFGGAVAAHQQTTLFGGGVSKTEHPAPSKQQPGTTRSTTTTGRTTSTAPSSTTTGPGTTSTSPQSTTTATAPRTSTQTTASTAPTTTTPTP